MQWDNNRRHIFSSLAARLEANYRRADKHGRRNHNLRIGHNQCASDYESDANTIYCARNVYTGRCDSEQCLLGISSDDADDADKSTSVRRPLSNLKHERSSNTIIRISFADERASDYRFKLLDSRVGFAEQQRWPQHWSEGRYRSGYRSRDISFDRCRSCHHDASQKSEEEGRD